MRINRMAWVVTLGLWISGPLVAEPSAGHNTKKIVLISGETAKVDVPGHHDYIAGCKCLDRLLSQNKDVECVWIENGWPSDEKSFDNASCVVFYTDGGGKQAFFESVARITKMQSLVDSGVGVVMIHQAVDVPEEYGQQAKRWLGGVYLKGKSGRGHWDSAHVDFPTHAITRGVEPWKINDGWLNGMEFVDEMKGITPLVWSGKEYAGSRAGLDRDIVAWSYDREKGGRSFVFTGLDAHAAWKLPGVRQLVVNGVLWSAGLEIPSAGAACEIEESQLDALLTPREPKKPIVKKKK